MKTGKALIENVNQYQSKDGTLAYWWMGQHSFIVKVGDTVLYFDPFLTDCPGRVIPPLVKAEEITNADYIFGSHDHGDHIDRPVWPTLAKASPKCKFVVADMHTDMLSKELGIPKDRFVGVDTDICYSDDKIRVYGVPAAHELLDTDPVTGKHPYMGFVVEVGDYRIYHSGDCCNYEGLQTALCKFGKIDLMMLPINGRDGFRLHHDCIGNMNFMEAADLAGAVKPGLVIPAHYETFEGNRFITEAMMFAEFVEAKYPDQKFWLGMHGERMLLPKED